jgi:hypothetical protein
MVCLQSLCSARAALRRRTCFGGYTTVFSRFGSPLLPRACAVTGTTPRKRFPRQRHPQNGDDRSEARRCRRRLQLQATRSSKRRYGPRKWRRGFACAWEERVSSQSCLKGFLRTGFKVVRPASSCYSRCGALAPFVCAHAPSRRCARGPVVLFLFLLW